MHPSSTPSRYPHWLVVFLAGAVPALVFALVTRHAWEDWYITYRAARNLATGYGLVFEHGQRLHTFTSPVNVLLPAALRWLTGNDDAVLWLYRVLGAGLLGGTALWLQRLARQQGFSRQAFWFLLALFVVDGKIMDFTINGQEAAFMVFFLAMMLVALLEQRRILLGVAWAGLMWSRPDSFIYIGAVSAGYVFALLLGNRQALPAAFRNFVLAGVLTAFLYGPWIVWTTWYYGTPIPHTIIAKGLGATHDPAALALQFVRFPWDALVGNTAARQLFMPQYYAAYGGWPQWMAYFGQGLAWLAAMAWLCPRVSLLVRTGSLGVFAGLYYLSYVTPFPYPWYFPACMFLAVVVLAGLLQSGIARFAARPELAKLVAGASVATVLVWLSVTGMMAWQLRVQQQVIEFGNRQPLGLWLKEQAEGRRDTVFLECLGYIGFYSGLKMYDYPGMSSPEMVAARRQYGEDWLLLIRALQPDWLVLRPQEVDWLYARDPALLTRQYHGAKVFDQSARLREYAFLPGRAYLQYDQTFLVFRRNPAPVPQ